MADSLVLKGTKHVVDQTGNEMMLVRPKRGGDTHQVPRWWALKKSVQYTAAAIINVSSTAGALALVVPVGENSILEVRHNGDGTFLFPQNRGIDRVAVMSEDLKTFYVEYQFAKISGGPVLKRTVNALPTGNPVQFTGSTDLSGDPNVGGEATIVAAPYTGGSNVTAVEVQLQKSADGSTGWGGFSAWEPSPQTVTLGANVENQYVRGVTRVTDDSGTVTGGVTGALGPIGPAVVTTADINNATFTYVVTEANGEFELNGVANAGIAGTVGDSFYFDLSDASLSGHPFKIYTDDTKTTEVTVGVVQSGTDLLFTPPIAGTFSYQCENHADMGGVISVSDLP